MFDIIVTIQYHTCMPIDPPPMKKLNVGVETKQPALTEAQLQKLADMSKEQLITLIKRVSGAMWGIGMQTQEERDAAILLKLSILALTSEEAKDVVSTAKEYFDRSRGRPMQSIDVNQKIGIVQIVMEAAKLRNGSIPLVDVTPA